MRMSVWELLSYHLMFNSALVERHCSSAVNNMYQVYMKHLKRDWMVV